MKILLVMFKASIGIKLNIEEFEKNFKSLNIPYVVCADHHYASHYTDHVYYIAHGGSGLQMMEDTLNPLNYIKWFKLLLKEKPTHIYFYGPHSLNTGVTLLTKLFFRNIQVVSHVHDPEAHSGVSYAKMFYYFSKTQSQLSDKLIVYGEKLMQLVAEKYGVSKKKIFRLTIGSYEMLNDVPLETVQIDKNYRYISLLGRIQDYKGIDVLLQAMDNDALQKKLKQLGMKVLIGGHGDFSPYQDLLARLDSDVVEVRNYLVPNTEFNEILKNSYVCLLPYKNATQTGTIQVAYLNRCPVVVTDEGSLPELVEEGVTGMIIKSNSPEALRKALYTLMDNENLREHMAEEGYRYSQEKLQWGQIVKNELLPIFETEIEKR